MAAKTILIVDDDKDLALGLKALLETKGYRIVTAHDGDAGLTAAAKIIHPRRKLLPSREGKRSMALQGLALGSYALAEMIRERQPQLSTVVRGTSHVLGAAGLFYYGPRATNGYVRRLR